MGGGFGASRPGQTSKNFAARRRWHEGCLRTGAMIATRRGQERAGAGVFFAGSNQRDSEAAGWNTRRSYISMNRAVGRVVARGDGGDPKPEAPLADTGFRGGFEYNCSCVPIRAS